MKLSTVTPADIRRALLLREEIALLDLRYEAAFATGHPLFAANMAADRIAIEAEVRLPRKDVAVVLYDDGRVWSRRAQSALRRSATAMSVRSMAG